MQADRAFPLEPHDRVETVAHVRGALPDAVRVKAEKAFEIIDRSSHLA